MEDFSYEKFWDLFEEGGAVDALKYATEFAKDEDGYTQVIQEHVPGLIEVAKERGVNMIDFLSQLDELEQQALAEKEDAVRTDNDGGELSVDSGADTDTPEDADEPAEPSDDDGQAGDGAEEAEGSTGA